MRKYYRVMLGQRSAHAELCFAQGFIGADFGVERDLTGDLSNDWRGFNEKLIPIYLAGRPLKTQIAAGLACGALWTIAKGIEVGDVVLCPDGKGGNRPGEVSGEYRYEPGGVLQHRRPVRWLDGNVAGADMTESLRRSYAYLGTVSDLSPYGAELERLVGGQPVVQAITTTDAVQAAAAFALEKHLEDFLIRNWSQTELGKIFDIYQGDEEGDQGGQQFMTDTGPMDILCRSKDKKTLLVIELKKGRASDAVVGQILRYMGYVKEELAEDGQEVRGVIIAAEDDQRIKRALAMVSNVAFYRYEIDFRLVKAVG